MRIFVTGGIGYIGSHVIEKLLNADHSIVVADNLSNSNSSTVEKIKKLTDKKLTFYEVDVTDEMKLETIFVSNKIDGVIHFAGLKSVVESTENPLQYYYNNVVGTIVLSKLCLKYGVGKFVFSSSATVYGENVSPFIETMELLPTTNPYGETKAMSERILMDAAKAKALIRSMMANQNTKCKLNTAMTIPAKTTPKFLSYCCQKYY